MRYNLRTLLAIGVTVAVATSCTVRTDQRDDPWSADPFSEEEQDTVNRGTGAVPTYQQMIVAVDELFDFDPTLDPVKDAQQNATAIYQRILGQLGGSGGAGCGSVSLTDTSVTVGFGVAPGCKTLAGNVISGGVSASVTKSGSALTVSLAFTRLVVNEQGIDGSATFSTSSGNVFTVDASIRSGSTLLTATALTVTGEPGAITVGGQASLTRNAIKTALTFNAVRWKKGQCYPEAGAVAIKQGLVRTTITFTSDTPSTGKVNVTILGKTSTSKLKAYATCGV